eukprot:6172965-Pleurochrysis_carterae.AAC.1
MCWLYEPARDERALVLCISQGPARAVDGSLGTKWLDMRFGVNGESVLELGLGRQQIHLDASMHACINRSSVTDVHTQRRSLFAQLCRSGHFVWCWAIRVVLRNFIPALSYPWSSEFLDKQARGQWVFSSTHVLCDANNVVMHAKSRLHCALSFPYACVPLPQPARFFSSHKGVVRIRLTRDAEGAKSVFAGLLVSVR